VFGISALLEKQRKRRRAETAEKAALEQRTYEEIKYDERLEKHERQREAGDKGQVQKKRVQWEEAQSAVNSFVCSGCGSSDRTKLSITKEGSVCACGVVHSMVNIVSSNRQKLGANEQDDKTVVADCKSLPTHDRYDGPPLSTEDARLQRLQRGKTGSSGLGGKRFGNGLGRICDAQVACDKMAAKEIVAREARAGIALLPRDMIKQRNVLKELETHFKTVSLTSHPIKRLVRIKVDKLYVQSVQHSYRCENHAQCEVRICDRHASCIAAVGFNYEIGRLLQLYETDENAQEFEGVDIPLLKEVYCRIKRSSVFQLLVPNNQLVACLHALKALDAPTFNYMRGCTCEAEEKEDNTVENPVVPFNMSSSFMSSSSIPSSIPSSSILSKSSKLPGGAPSISNMNRSLSLCSNGADSPGPNAQIHLRDSIFAVFAAHKSELQVSTRDLAVEFISTPEFSTLKSETVDDKENSISQLDASQIAFCILSAIHQSKVTSSKSVTSLFNLGGAGFNIGIAGRLGLGIESAEECIGKVRSVFDTHSGLETATDKDALFD
jgi:hypothetical protein